MKKIVPMLISMLMLLWLTACDNVADVKSKHYPGKNLQSDCHMLWFLGYETVNVSKCEHDLLNPKYNKGQKVSLVSGYDKSCYGIVLFRDWAWNPVLNENRYKVKVYCHAKEFSTDEITESELRKAY